MHRILKGFDFGHIQTTDIGVILPWTIAFLLETIRIILMPLLAGSQMSDCCPSGQINFNVFIFCYM